MIREAKQHVFARVVFELPGLADKEKEDILVEQLKISHEKARMFLPLLHEGYTTLEAVV